MKSKRTPAIVTTAVVLVVLGGLAALAQDKYTVKIPDGLAFSEFRGYETWQVVSVSHPAADAEMSGEVLNVIVAGSLKFGIQTDQGCGSGSAASAKPYASGPPSKRRSRMARGTSRRRKQSRSQRR